MRSSAITFDIDWAPEWAIEDCIELCEQYGVPATFFATHPSALLSDLDGSESFEVGIHPNFLPGSSHSSSGSGWVDPAEVLEHCLELVPGAQSMRTHGLVQSTRILNLVAEHFSQITGDSSIYMPLQTHLEPVDVYVGSNGRFITRVPFYWGDYNSCLDPRWSWDMEAPPAVGLRIFNFHPIHVALNSASLAPYESLRALTRGRPGTQIDRDAVTAVAESGEGTRRFLERLLSSANDDEYSTVCQIVGVHRISEKSKS